MSARRVDEGTAQAKSQKSESSPLGSPDISTRKAGYFVATNLMLILTLIFGILVAFVTATSYLSAPELPATVVEAAQHNSQKTQELSGRAIAMLQTSNVSIHSENMALISQQLLLLPTKLEEEISIHRLEILPLIQRFLTLIDHGCGKSMYQQRVTEWKQNTEAVLQRYALARNDILTLFSRIRTLLVTEVRLSRQQVEVCNELATKSLFGDSRASHAYNDQQCEEYTTQPDLLDKVTEELSQALYHAEEHTSRQRQAVEQLWELASLLVGNSACTHGVDKTLEILIQWLDGPPEAKSDLIYWVKRSISQSWSEFLWNWSTGVRVLRPGFEAVFAL